MVEALAASVIQASTPCGHSTLGGITPTIAKGWSLTINLRPITSRDPPYRRCQRAWVMTSTVRRLARRPPE